MESAKKFADRREKILYKFGSVQLGFEDFGQAAGVRLSPENRWVRKASLVPWEAIEGRYAALFPSGEGNVAKPLRLALGALLIQTEREISDEETAIQIMETPCLQWFCGRAQYEEKMPFDPSLMVYFRRRLTPEILGEINEMIIRASKKANGGNKKGKRGRPRKGGKNDDDDNSGTLILDATCAPCNIKYPQDTELLNDAREKLEGLIDHLHDPSDGEKPRTYRRKARKAYLKTARKRKKTKSEIRKAIGAQLRYIKRDLGIIERYLADGKTLTKKQAALLETLKKIYEQQLFMHSTRTHSVPERIVSIHQPHLRPIVRGKVRTPVEFGPKLDISVADGFVRVEKISFEAYNESENLQTAIERYKKRTGRYPQRVLTDKIYRNRDNLAWCRERGIRLSGPALGRPKKDATRDKTLEYKDLCDRVEVERAFSLAKRKFGLGLLRTTRPETTLAAVAASILALNLAKLFYPFLSVLKSTLFPPRFHYA